VVRDLTILLPAYNEARRLPASLEKALAWAGRQAGRFERVDVLVVDDGSTDGTAELVERRFGGRVRVVRRARRGGKGAALRTGVAEVRTEWLLFADADLSIPIEEYEQLAPGAERAPIVIGSKRAPGSEVHYPEARRFLGGIGQKLIAWLVVGGFYDTQCGFKLYRTDVAQLLFRAQRIDGFGFDFEVLFLAKRLGIAVEEVPIRCQHQIGGTVRMRTYLTVLGEIAAIWWHRVAGHYPDPAKRSGAH
jgi:dolichyl-phosphate beta-glucosyltransferase